MFHCGAWNVFVLGGLHSFRVGIAVSKILKRERAPDILSGNR